MTAHMRTTQRTRNGAMQAAHTTPRSYAPSSPLGLAYRVRALAGSCAAFIATLCMQADKTVLHFVVATLAVL